jgi:hypothetical protein
VAAENSRQYATLNIVVLYIILAAAFGQRLLVKRLVKEQRQSLAGNTQ